MHMLQTIDLNSNPPPPPPPRMPNICHPMDGDKFGYDKVGQFYNG